MAEPFYSATNTWHHSDACFVFASTLCLLVASSHLSFITSSVPVAAFDAQNKPFQRSSWFRP